MWPQKYNFHLPHCPATNLFEEENDKHKIHDLFEEGMKNNIGVTGTNGYDFLRSTTDHIDYTINFDSLPPALDAKGAAYRG